MFYVLGILGYKIHFDKNGDAEFNMTLLDMQAIGKQSSFFLVMYDRREGKRGLRRGA